MGGVRQNRAPSKASHRRHAQAHQDRVHRRITIASLTVLAIVAVVVAIGVVLTVVLPPRAHVLTVGDRSYDAGQVAERAELAVRGGSQETLSDPAGVTIDTLVREEVLLRAGGPLVDEVAPADLQDELHSRLGLDADAEDEEYATTYQRFLDETGVEQAAFERSVRASVIDDRLVEQYLADVPESGAQVQLEGASSADRMQLESLREAVAGGDEFAAAAVELGLLPGEEAASIGWVLPETLGAISDAVEGTETGGLSQVVQAGGTSYAVYRVADRDDAREYDEAQRQQLAQAEVDDWIEQQRATVGVQEDLSDDEDGWITRRVIAAAIDMQSQ